MPKEQIHSPAEKVALGFSCWHKVSVFIITVLSYDLTKFTSWENITYYTYCYLFQVKEDTVEILIFDREIDLIKKGKTILIYTCTWERWQEENERKVRREGNRGREKTCIGSELTGLSLQGKSPSSIWY